MIAKIENLWDLVSIKEFFIKCIANSEWNSDVDQDSQNNIHGDEAPVLAADAVAAARTAITAWFLLIVCSFATKNEPGQIIEVLHYIVTSVFVQLDLLSAILESNIGNIANNAVLRLDGQDVNVRNVADAFLAHDGAIAYKHFISNVYGVKALIRLDLRWNRVVAHEICQQCNHVTDDYGDKACDHDYLILWICRVKVYLDTQGSQNRWYRDYWCAFGIIALVFCGVLITWAALKLNDTLVNLRSNSKFSLVNWHNLASHL